MSYADIADDTTAARFLHEFPHFHQVSSDDVVDSLLEKDAKKHGISAVVMYHYNGTVFFTDGKDDGSYIGVDEFQKGKFFIDIVSDAVERIAEFIKILGAFPFEIAFYSDLCDGEIIEALEKAGVVGAHITRGVAQYIYTGAKKELKENSLSIKPLSIDDLGDIKEWASRFGNDWKLEWRLTQRDIYRNDAHDKPYEIYDGSTLVGVAGMCLYELKGFRIGETEGIGILEKYRNRQNSDFIYNYLINELLSSEHLPFCSYVGKPTDDATDLIPERYGFEAVKSVCTFDRQA